MTPLEFIPIAAELNELAARNMQALSLGFHIILVPFAITFPAIMLFTEYLHYRTGDPLYRTIARRWSYAMLTVFAVGAVSGTILSFEFGILWPGWMDRFGDVFGLAFTLEGVAFFIEAIFIAIYLYTWDRLPPKTHMLVGLPIVLAGQFAALLVISVNGWMNSPTGFDFNEVTGAVTNIAPWHAIFGNTTVWIEFVHMLLAAYMVAGFVTAAIYAGAWLRGKRDRYHRVAFVIPFTLAALVTPVQLVVGDVLGQYVARDQPVKLAAMEGLQETTSGADLNLLGYYDESTGEIKGGINIPDGLSLIAFHDPDATVQGLDTVPAEDRPPVNIVRYSFQFMVGIGSALMALVLWYGYMVWRKRRLPATRWFYYAAIAAAPAVVLAMILGWIVTEVGRQPWIVYEVMRTTDAVTQSDGIVWLGGALAIVYVLLGVGTVYILRRLARRPIHGQADDGPASSGGGG
ncbi:MAG: cytochrome ubiquinol oxidase subunit I [Planctomycetota bacterium]|nr:cytochrome ubiquinol oxidase subunit I [Planctomycetota bacterium]